MNANKNAEAYEALLEQGRKAHREGQPMHSNPYDYMLDASAVDAWDDGWNEAAR